MVVVKDDRIVDEYYKDGYDETSVFRLYSCSKSVTSALMGIAIDKGLIDGVDVPVSAYFPQAAQGRSDGIGRITILWWIRLQRRRTRMPALRFRRILRIRSSMTLLF